jgi:hypothetical protein
VIATFHPAAILHGGGEKSRQFVDLQDDFALIRRTLNAAVRPEVVRDSAGPAAPSEGGTPAPPSPVGDEQMELF